MSPMPDLNGRYLLEEGPVFLSGIQALVRLPLDQSRRDRRAGLRIGTFISGYPGSPLGGYDLALRQAKQILERHEVLHVPARNEESAATAIAGTQMLDHHRHPGVDGVVGIFYGKGPGIDRSGDALKHGNFAGTSRNGAVVVLSGEDHEAKSSTMPHQEEYAFMGHGMPILYPATTADFLSLGLHAIALSRYSGCWVAFKLVASLADGGEIIDLVQDQPRVVLPALSIDGRPFRKSTDFTFFPGSNLETERRLYYERHRAVLAYARANALSRVVVEGPHDRLGLVSAGKSYTDLVQALQDLGLDATHLRQLGVRVLRLDLIYPLDVIAIRHFASGLEQIVVVEEKRDFIEAQVKAALSGIAAAPQVIGKYDERDIPLLPIHGAMDADTLALLIGSRLLALSRDQPEISAGIDRRRDTIQAIRRREATPSLGRMPNYCSGCPHSLSTRLLPDQLAWGSPGCHSFASIIEQPERHISAMTQLGGEGLPWIGLSPYTERQHIVQNVGDGSLFHSSFLNIGFCVAAGVNITFKILFNGVVANTGAQDAVAGTSLPTLIRELELEGVKQIALITQDPGRYRATSLPANTRVFSVQDQDQALRQLSSTPGVTAFIYDGFCANERRRRRRRGTEPLKNRFVVINEEVCEGCGHCGALTNCMSLHPVSTEFGEKTRIHASSCNQDDSCLGGECPAFLTVETHSGTGYRRPRPAFLPAADLAEPVRCQTGLPFKIYIPGLGGTGVVTLNAILAWAALMDGKRVLSYDQLGAAQKWGAVLSSLILHEPGQERAANSVGAGQADLYLALDVLAAATLANLARCHPDKTAAVVNSTLFPSGEMVRNIHAQPSVPALLDAITRCTVKGHTHVVDARRLAEGLFGDHMATNVFALGFAYQAGFMPLSATSIEAAIGLNGTEVELNTQAFRYGRLTFSEPNRVEAIVSAGAPGRQPATQELTRGELAAYHSELARCATLDDETRRVLAIRVAELILYQDAAYAHKYIDFVLRVATREVEVLPGSNEITGHVARNLYKLLAYKDEYEVARLHTRAQFLKSTLARFEAPRSVVYHLRPPVLQSLGLRRKLGFGAPLRPALYGLRALRRLRGTIFDPFRWAGVRREERGLIAWYRDLVLGALASLTHESRGRVLELVRLPEGIRGYEEIKLNNAGLARKRAEELLRELNVPFPPAHLP